MFDLPGLMARLATIAGDRALDDEGSLAARLDARDLCALIEELARVRGRSEPELVALARQATAVERRLREVDERLFARVRAGIRGGELRGDALRRELDRFTAYTPDQTAAAHVGFDALDALVGGALRPDGAVEPVPTRPVDPEMVHYEPTPARAILDLVDHAGLGPDDVVYDLGAGLGRVALLVHLLAGVRAVGIEYQPAYCAYARGCAADLRLDGVRFVNADARDADYSDGTVFYLFTPFRGKLLVDVLARLHKEAQTRPITVCTYGTCTRQAFLQPWLRSRDPSACHDYRLAIFWSGC